MFRRTENVCMFSLFILLLHLHAIINVQLFLFLPGCYLSYIFKGKRHQGTLPFYGLANRSDLRKT